MHRSNQAIRLLALVIAALALFTGACSDSTDKEPFDRMVFMAGFKAQANLPFVAAYVAETMGYFRDQHLDVEIRHASSGEHLKLLIAGDVDVTTASGASVLKRRADPDLPVVAFALFGQQSQQAFVALKDSGIETPKDWEGKIFGYKTSVPPEYLAILEANGVDRSKITEVRVGFDPRILTEGKVDILAVFNSNEPDTIRRLGFDVNVWEPVDFGVPSMGLTYITRNDLVEEEPDKIERFLKATMKGLRYALDNPDRALHIVMLNAPQNDLEHERFMLRTELGDAVSPLTQTDGLGWMTDGQWKAFYEQLLKFDALPGPLDYRTAYTDQFLKAVYFESKVLWP
ncbi:MAG: ABC transporter substrate-binding protein [SAR202 cluster bacterium]|nr:ABC transporter substrate-binding protein [SAR202 cluster bacterium]